MPTPYDVSRGLQSPNLDQDQWWRNPRFPAMYSGDDAYGNPVEPPVNFLPYSPDTPEPTPTPGAPVPGPSGGASTSGGSSIPPWLQQILSGVTGGGGASGLPWASILPAMAAAWQQYQNAGRYEDLGREASGMASPVSTETRRGYQDRLRQLYENPTAFLEGSPEFRASRELGQGALFARNNARGLGSSGAASDDQMRFLSNLGAQHINQERDDLMTMGGFQFDPANSARMLMEGGRQGIEARNSALAALLYPFGAAAGGQGGGSQRGGSGSPTRPPGTGGGPGGGGGGFNMNPQQVAGLAQRLGVNPQQLWQWFGQLQSPWGIDPQTQQSIINSGLAEIMGWDETDPSSWGLGGTGDFTDPGSGMFDVPWGGSGSGGEFSIDNLPPWASWGSGGDWNSWIPPDWGSTIPDDWWQDIDFSTWW